MPGHAAHFPKVEAVAADAIQPAGPASRPASSASSPAGAGTAPGINIEPGSLDDGWTVPQPVRLSDGTRLQYYKDGEALHAAYRAIEHARRRICLEVYIFRSDDTGWAFARLLAKKARQGVPVYLLYDSFGSFSTDKAMFHEMEQAGVRLECFHPVEPWKCRHSWRLANRDHRKLLVIDDDTAGLGGLNIGAEYAGSWIVSGQSENAPWRDNSVGLVGPGARLLMVAFSRTWRYVQRGGRMGNAQFLHNLDNGELGVLATVPTRHSPLHFLRRLFRQARSSILLTMSYFAPPDELIEDLCRAARRGVRVRLMLPAMSDVKLMLIAARAFYERLLSAGVEIYERQGAVLHAKTLCVDGHTTVLGSTNLDHFSIELNLEVSAIIRSDEFGEQMRLLFENDVLWSEQIHLSAWRRRPLRDRFVQWAVTRARHIL